jgi:AAA domain
VSATVRDLLRVLSEHALDVRLDDEAEGAWDADCPICRPLSEGLWPLRITEAQRGGPVRLRCINPCGEHAILSALGLADDAPISESANGDGEYGKRPKLRTLDVERMLVTDPPAVPWIAEPLLVRGAVTMLAGREGTGKSMLALALAAAVGHGSTVAGIACEPGRVLVVDAENGPAEVHRRVRGLGVKPQTLIYAEAEAFDLCRDLGEVEGLLRRHRPEVLVLDSLRALAPGLDENESASAELVLGPLRKLARRWSCAILVLHHSRKSGDEYRGSTGIGGAVELMFTLARENGISPSTRRKLICWKCRPATEPAPLWFTLQADGTRILIQAAQPATSAPRRSRTVELSGRLGEIAAEQDPQPWGALCATAGVDPESSTAKRARDRALRDGVLVKVKHGIYGPPAQPSVRPHPVGELDERTDGERGER